MPPYGGEYNNFWQAAPSDKKSKSDYSRKEN